MPGPRCDRHTATIGWISRSCISIPKTQMGMELERRILRSQVLHSRPHASASWSALVQLSRPHNGILAGKGAAWLVMDGTWRCGASGGQLHALIEWKAFEGSSPFPSPVSEDAAHGLGSPKEPFGRKACASRDGICIHSTDAHPSPWSCERGDKETRATELSNHCALHHDREPQLSRIPYFNRQLSHFPPIVCAIGRDII
jgi:hypothetical protein